MAPPGSLLGRSFDAVTIAKLAKRSMRAVLTMDEFPFTSRWFRVRPEKSGRAGMKAERLLMGMLLGGVAIGCVVVLYPFVSAILWAAILTFTTWPLFQALRHRLRIGARAAAGLMVLATALVVVVPLALVVPGSGTDVKEFQAILAAATASGLPAMPAWIGDVPLVGPLLQSAWTEWARDLGVMAGVFRPYFGIAAEVGFRLVLGLANGVLEFLLALLVAFFLYASGEALAAKIESLLRRIAGDRAERLIGVTGATVRGVVYGILGTAVVQGMLTVFGLWVSGVPRRCCWG